MRFKRFSAFMIDIILIGILMIVIENIVPIKDATYLNENMMELTEQVLNNEISMQNYYNEFAVNTYIMDKNSVFVLGLNTLIVILYFIAVPIITKGFTLGKYVVGIKYEGKLNIWNLFLRNIVTTGILQMILSIILIYVTKDTTYLTLTLILGFIQILLVIISAFMVLYRSDLKGIQDMISKIKVVQIKEVK